jgi:hypothetical protein
LSNASRASAENRLRRAGRNVLNIAEFGGRSRHGEMILAPLTDRH